MKIVEFYYCWTLPWRECEICFLGPSVLNQGTHIRVAIGLFFLEIGIVVRKEQDESLLYGDRQWEDALPDHA